MVSAAEIWAASSFVSLPCSSMDLRIVSLRSSRFRRYFSRSSNCRRISSSRPPVLSFLYLAINGMVLPSSISSMTAVACAAVIFSSLEIVFAISIGASIPQPSGSRNCSLLTPVCYVNLPGPKAANSSQEQEFAASAVDPMKLTKIKGSNLASKSRICCLCCLSGEIHQSSA